MWRGLLVTGFVGVAMYAVFYPACSRYPNRPPVRNCVSTLKQLGNATMVYVVDFDDRFPVDRWIDVTMPYVKNEGMYHCNTRENPDTKYGFAMNLDVSGRRLEELNEKTVLYFETDARARNVIANLAAQNKSRHKGFGAQVSVATRALLVKE
jgi:hypothetical protein